MRILIEENSQFYSYPKNISICQVLVSSLPSHPQSSEKINIGSALFDTCWPKSKVTISSLGFLAICSQLLKTIRHSLLKHILALPMVGKINASFKICSIDLGHPVQEQFWDFCLSEIQTSARGGVKLEFVRNSFHLIQKLAIQLIWRGKKISKNSINFNSKFFDLKEKNLKNSQIFQIQFSNLRNSKSYLLRYHFLLFNFEFWLSGLTIEKNHQFSWSLTFHWFEKFEKFLVLSVQNSIRRQNNLICSIWKFFNLIDSEATFMKCRSAQVFSKHLKIILPIYTIRDQFWCWEIVLKLTHVLFTF